MGFKRIAAVVAGIAVAATGTVAIVDPPLIIGQGPVVTGGTTPASSHLWMATNGTTNCVRNAVPVSLTTALASNNACSTPAAACAAYQSGDTVVIAAGMYTVAFTESCSNITFTNVPNTFADFEVWGTISGSNVTLQGDAIGHGVGLSLGYMAVSGANVTWNNVNLYCQAIPGNTTWIQEHSALTNEDGCAAFVHIVSSATGFTWNGGDQENVAGCKTSCTITNGPGVTSPQNDESSAQNMVVEHVTVKHYFALDNNGSSGLHSELWFLNGGNGISFIDDSFTACLPPPGLGYVVGNSCNSSYIFVGCFSCSGNFTTTNNLTMIQDIVAPGNNGVPQKSFQSGDIFPLGTEQTWTFLYDDFDHALTLCGTSNNNKCQPTPLSSITGSNMTFAGNVALYTTGFCFTSGTYSHDTWFDPTGSGAGKCGTTDTSFNFTPDSNFWTAPDTFDFSPLAVIQAAGENTYCATIPGGVDINGKARPTLTPCDAGAVQH